MVLHGPLSHRDSGDTYCHQMTYRCRVVVPEVSHNWEERVLTFQSKMNKASHVCSSLRTVVTFMWVDDLVIEKLNLDLYLVVCVHP